ncbi:MAG: hypothetical protein ACWA5T_06220 [Parvularcula sp.]
MSIAPLTLHKAETASPFGDLSNIGEKKPADETAHLLAKSFLTQILKDSGLEKTFSQGLPGAEHFSYLIIDHVADEMAADMPQLTDQFYKQLSQMGDSHDG